MLAAVDLWRTYYAKSNMAAAVKHGVSSTYALYVFYALCNAAFSTFFRLKNLFSRLFFGMGANF